MSKIDNKTLCSRALLCCAWQIALQDDMFVHSLRSRTALSVFCGPNTYYTDSWLHGVAQTGDASHNHAICFSNQFKSTIITSNPLTVRSIWPHHAHLSNPCVKRVALCGWVWTLFQFYWQHWNKDFLITQVKKKISRECFLIRTSLINPSLQGLIFILLILNNVFVPSEPHMPSCLIITDGQKITFSISITGKCMSCTA